MAKTLALARKDFLIKDLAISISAGGGGGSTWLPGPDDKTPPSPISPIASIVANLSLIEAVRGTIVEAVKAGKFEEVGRAFVEGDAGGNAAIRASIQQIGAAVVASAAFGALGGKVGLVDPDCGGTSFEHIPTSITPVVNVGFAAHKVADLPRLKAQLAQATAYLDKAAAAQAPRGAEVADVRAHLQGALKDLG
jgi:hypothetical protein